MSRRGRGREEERKRGREEERKRGRDRIEERNRVKEWKHVWYITPDTNIHTHQSHKQYNKFIPCEFS